MHPRRGPASSYVRAIGPGAAARRWLIGGLAAALAATVMSGLTPSAQAAPDAAAGGVSWGTCDDPFLQDAGAQCALLSVPLDYGKPGGEKIKLAISRIEHTVPDDQAQGIMLANPGGPGGSGLVFSFLGNLVPHGAGGYYDWIGFDPRGVGSSEPALSCDPNYFAGPRPDYVPSTRAIEQRWLSRSEGYAEACDADGGALLDHLKTTDNARDMDSIRKALGANKLNFYGFSYGTYLGQVYATLFPDRVRRMVLDSNVDPRPVWYRFNLQQDVSFERVMQHWFAWIAQYDSVYHLGTSKSAVEDAFYAAQDKLRAQPEGVLGPAEWIDAFTPSGYVAFLWPDQADAFAAFVNNSDPGPATAWYQGFDGVGDDNGFAMYLATECTDAPWPHNWDKWRRDNWRVDKEAPFLTWANAWFNAPCAFWPAGSDTPVNVKDHGVPPILLIGETLDGATPFTGSLEVRRRFDNAVLIAKPGGVSHATSLSGLACEDDRIAAYLTDGSLPDRKSGNGPDVRCAPLPLPVPGARSMSGAAAELLRLRLLSMR